MGTSTGESTPSARVLNGYVGISVLSFLEDGRLFVADVRGKVDFWQRTGPEPEHAMQVTTGPNYAMLPLPDGRVAIGGDGFRRPRPRPPRSRSYEDLLALRGHRSAINALALTADGRLVSGGRDGEVMLWNLKAPMGRQLVRLAGPGSGAKCTVSSNSRRPDRRRGPSGTVTIWPTAIDPLLARAEAVVGRNLTQKEWLLHFPGQPFRPTFSKLPTRE